MLLERLNLACANEKERQDKKEAHTDAVQSSNASDDKKCAARRNIATLPPDVLSDLKEIKANIVLLKDLKAEIPQIRESILKTEAVPKLSSC